MDSRLLEYFDSELAVLREAGQEFAAQYPKVASRLGTDGVEVSDPYVERLLEGFGFLTARIRLKMDAQFPQFSQRLLDALYPNYLAPTPSMAIVELQPRMAEQALLSGFSIPRNSPMHAAVAKGESTACEFRTAHDVTLWPLEIVAAVCSGAPPDLPLAGLQLARAVKGALRIRLKTSNGMPLAQLAVDQLTFYLAGTDDIASRLYEIIFGHALGVVGCEPHRPLGWMEFLGADAIGTEGFDSEQSMLPYHARAFQGYRLLHEYFAFPNRFQFFRLSGLQKFVCQAQGDTLDLTILLDCPVGDLENLVGKRQLALFCTPVVNLFPKRGDRLAVDPQLHEHHIVADKTRPLDYEIYSVASAVGYEDDPSKSQQFRSFYASLGQDDGVFGAYYSVRREPRVASESAKRSGTRTNYVGSEVFIALVDQRNAPYNQALRHLSVDMLCTNRDLPLLIPIGGASDFEMAASIPLKSIKIMRGPTEPATALADSAMTWRLISHLNLNYLALSELDAGDGAQALRELLSLYALLSDLALKKQIDAVQRNIVKPITRRLPQKGPLVFGRGVGIDLTVDESLFAGTSPYLFGAVLAQFFARHVGLNVFAETALHSLQRGEIARWKPTIGKRPVA
ncbi:MAG: type VI secretion system baseplate subunit TssF [Burkholderiaceae bacterium]|nr:type VI secretion system baseplate subunit TssF [Burkholderiaceae bacterium]